MKRNTLRYIISCAMLLLLLSALALTLGGCGECDTHYYEEEIIKHPTCIDAGQAHRTCISCGEEWDVTLYPSEDYHDFKTVSIEDPTCTKPGKENVICSYCKVEGYYEIESTGHNYKVETDTQPTCTEDGKKITVCTKCDYENVETRPASHSYGSAFTVKEPTCLEEGTEQYTCSVCGTSGTNPIAALGHEEVDTPLLEPTCQENGLTVGTKCNRCGITMSGRASIDKVDHVFEGESCKWCLTLKTYTVTYVCEGGSFPNESYKSGQTITLPSAADLENENNAFVGWFTSNGVQYTNTSVVVGDITLYAKFDTYITISDVAGLAAIADAPDKNYKLTQNIDASGIIWTPIDNFTGSLNGNNYSIYNIVLGTTESKDFGFVRVNNGTIKNLEFKDFTFNATYTPIDTLHFGVVSGRNNGKIQNVRITRGSVIFVASRSHNNSTHYSTFGLIAGSNNAGAVISECTGTVDIDFTVKTSVGGDYYSGSTQNSYYYLSGLVGINKATLSDSKYEGKLNLKATASSSDSCFDDHFARNYVFLGSVTGENNGGYIERCSALSELVTTTSTNRGTSSNHINAGVLVGKNVAKGTIEFSYAGGSILATASSTNYIGGFIGFNEKDSSVKSCYTTADTQTAGGAYVGGFVGSNSGFVQNSYSAGEVTLSGSGRTGGFVGSLNSSGTVSKSYSTGDVTCNGGSVGHFLGYAEGAVLKCYFMDSSTVMSGGTYLPIVTEYNTVEGIVYTTLWNEDFLINEMYWEDYGWIVITDENPLLSWEIEKNHSFVTTVIEPTCERGGFTIYNCTDCSRLFIKDYVEPKGHKTETVVTIPATCAAEGYTLIKCTVDGCTHEEKINLLPKTEHKTESLSVKSRTEPTCLNSGKVIYYCSDCKNGDIILTLEPLGHDGKYVSTKVPVSCKADGTDIYFCSREGCGEYELTVPALPHTVVKVEYQAPSCGRHIGEGGESTYTPEDGHMPGEMCSVCNTVIGGCDVIPAHNFVLKSTAEKATCTTDGLGTYVCSDCEFSLDGPITKNGHKDEDLNNVCDVCKVFTFTTVPESAFIKISDVAGLEAIRNNLSGYYILSADIDLTGYEWTAIGTSENPFKGMLYGAGHKIKGLSLKADGVNGTLVYGLFGYNKGHIVNLNIESISVEVNNLNCVIGGIAAYNMGEIMGCNISGSSSFKLELNIDVNGYTHRKAEYVMTVGGIVGINDQTGKMQHCKSTGHVDAILNSNTAITASGALSYLDKLIYDTKAETKLDVTFGAIAGKNEGEISFAEVKEKIGVTMAFTARLAYQKGRINAAFNVYAADLVGYNSGSIVSSLGVGAAYTYAEGYNYKNFVDKFFKGKLCETTVTFVNHSENTMYEGIIGGNEGTVIN